ncbi:MAG TPA: DUF4394 domain-containing protein [Actinomycetes bacterium]|nr:DUF4394 domain-containing protein [Actinomycetes bacterium]
MRRTVLNGTLAIGIGALIAAAAFTGSSGSGRSSGSEDRLTLAGLSRQAGSGPTQQVAGAPRLVVVGLTDDQRIVAFLASNPRNQLVIGKVSGLAGDASLVGIDYRIQNGKLYGVGNAGGIYTVSTRTARATKVSQLTVALRGTAFGVDFNPAANRLRVISDAGQNLRHNIDDPNGAPAAGMTAEDGTLTYPPATTAAAGVTAAAYTNNDLDPNTATTLFDLDSTLDQIAIQSPANAGSLAPTGKLGVDAATGAGFDIFSPLNDQGTSTGTIGLATVQVGGKYALYRIGTLTGKATLIGAFPDRRQVVDIAIPLNQD